MVARKGMDMKMKYILKVQWFYQKKFIQRLSLCFATQNRPNKALLLKNTAFNEYHGTRMLTGAMPVIPLPKRCLSYTIAKKSLKNGWVELYLWLSIHIRDYVLHSPYRNYTVSWFRTKLINPWEISIVLSKHFLVLSASILHKLKNYVTQNLWRTKRQP